MSSEARNHLKHIGVTFDRLMELLFSREELDLIFGDADHCGEHLSSRSRWIRVSDLAVPEVNTERMALVHLLWLQKVGRVTVEDIDPYSGAVLLRLNVAGLKKVRERFES